MKLKIVVERCIYDRNDNVGIEVTDIIESKEFNIDVACDEIHHFYAPTDRSQMLKPIIYMIELAVLDNLDYSEIAEACGVSAEFMDAVDAYDPTQEEYLIDILSELLFSMGCSEIIPAIGNVMYKTLYVWEDSCEI